jgi:hypothetical protein
MAHIKQSQSEESYKQKDSQSTTYKQSKTVIYQPLSIHASSLIVKSKKINTMGMENTQNSGRILLLTVNTGTLSALRALILNYKTNKHRQEIAIVGKMLCS